jgi:very-short-patch-repair endonuclease
MADPSPIKTLLDAPEHLLATHDRLRTSGFPVVSIVNAPSALEARLWLCQWARARGRRVFMAPTTDPRGVLAAYRARMPTQFSGPDAATALECQPLIIIPGTIQQALASSRAVSAEMPRLSLALACGIAGVVDSLVDPLLPHDLVIAALQGLVPVEDTTRQLVHTVAAARDMRPFLRGPCEGLLYFMLEARAETRGRFRANLRVAGRHGSFELDLGCAEARLAVEIDGPEHDTARQKSLDARKQQALKDLGWRVWRFANREVTDNPVGVWRRIASQLPEPQRTEKSHDA